MKKYLINGLLALVAGGFAASCADHDVDYVPIAQQKTQAYDKAFKEMIGGDVDPNQNWGFEEVSAPNDFDPLAAARALTRNNGAINVNGNMWNPEDVPAVDIKSNPTEVEAIFNYVNHTLAEMDNLGLRYSTRAPQNLNGYYVTQVRNGLNADNVYPDANGSTVSNVGNYMNHLQIAFNQNPSMADLNNATSYDNISGWNHINNFNASQNYDHANAAQSPDHGNTKVEDKGAYDFAYHNSKDSKYHNNWILIDGDDITNDHKYANFYYVCFDYESFADDIQTKFTFTGYNDSGSLQTNYNGAVNGYYTSVEQVLAALQKDGATTFVDTDGRTRNISEISDIALNGYNNGDKKIDPDDKHTDWIIRITKGAPTPPPSTNTTTTYRIKCKRLAVQGRVFCEDLGQVKMNDIDFNDIVFDARIWWTYEFDRVFDGTNYQDKNRTNFKYEAEICLLAAGGTITANVAGNDVHNLFKVGETTMVNTYDEHANKENMVTWEHMEDTKAPVTFTYDITDLVANNDGKVSLNLIPISVRWKNDDNNYNTMQGVGVLEANLGDVPHKICAPIGTIWPSERRNIKTVFPDFEAWAKDLEHTSVFYNNPNSDFQYSLNTVGLPTQDAYGRDYYTVNDGNIYTNYSQEDLLSQTSYAETETVLWSNDEGYAYGADGTGAPPSLTLYSTTFNAGDKLRVYGSKQADGGWIKFLYNENGYQPIVSTADEGTTSGTGYFDIPVDADDASHLSNGPTLYIAANNFTITKIAKLVVSQQ